MRLASPHDVTAHVGIERGELAGTGQKLLANVHPMIRIGAHKWKTTRQRLGQQRAIVLNRLAMIIDEAGADNCIRLTDAPDQARKLMQQRPAAGLRTDMIDRLEPVLPN